MPLPGLGLLRDSRLRAAVGVPLSQVALAAAGYVLLALASRAMPAGDFAAVSAFYLLLNTVGRGVFASIELETSRAMSAAREAGIVTAPVVAEAGRRAVVLIVLAVALSFAATPLLPGIEAAIALALGACSMALSYGVRGPLAATRRYSAYSATFLFEAVLTVSGAALLYAGGGSAIESWTAVLVLSPAIAAALVGAWSVGAGAADVVRRFGRQAWTGNERGAAPGSHRIGLAALLWTSLFYLSSQGVWNLVPVSVTSALAAVPDAAAGFVAVAVILRAPVFVFPAIQALLLPMVSAAAQRDDRVGTRSALRPLLLLLGVAAVPWLVAAILVVPWAARAGFAVDATPAWPVLLLLAASTVVGAGAFVMQTRVLAFRRHRDVGTAWFVGLVILGLVSLVPGDAQAVGACAQLAAAVVVLLGVLVADRRIGAVPPPTS